MKLISVNAGLPREVVWKDKTITTGIFKEPVEGRVRVNALNLEGDKQADLSVHGGPDKAIYTYPAEHYDYWRGEFPDMELPWGMFGENFTVHGLPEDSINIGDRFRVGTTEVMVTQPRMPCYKLGIRFGRADIVKRFLASRRTGFYLRVLQEGEIETGDSIELVSQDENKVSISEITRLYVSEKNDLEAMRRAVQVEALPGSWRDYFRKYIEK